MEATQEERRALLANDVRVLAAQLNEKLREASRKGLRVDVETAPTLCADDGWVSVPVVRVRVFAEVE